MIPHDITSPRLTLTAIDERHVGQRYLAWMTNPAVVEFTESRFSSPTIDDLRSFVAGSRASTDSYMFAIEITETGDHVGNIKLGPVNSHHKRGAIGIILGEQSAWGRGIATEAVTALSSWAFDELGIEKLIAGIYAANLGSVRAFEKAGFAVEGRQVDEVILADGTRGDALILGRLSR